MLPGETGHIGKTCKDCNTELEAQVCMSNAGYYIGTMCDCGPYSRESEYFSSREEAEEALAEDEMYWKRQ